MILNGQPLIVQQLSEVQRKLGITAGGVPSTRLINTTAPLTGGGDLSADRTLSIANAAADGATKGAAAFTAADFNATAGVVSIDYANGQAASSVNKGFLTSADWSAFNAKVSTSRSIATTAPLTGGGDLSADRTFALDFSASWAFAGNVGFYGTSPVAQRTQGATLTNNITSGGSANTLANYADLTLYANDAAAIRNNLYQLGQTLKTIVDGLRALGLFS